MTRPVFVPATRLPSRPVLSYRDAYNAGLPVVAPDCELRPGRERLIDRAPDGLVSAVAGAWALVSIVAAAAALVVLVLVVVRVVGVLA